VDETGTSDDKCLLAFSAVGHGPRVLCLRLQNLVGSSYKRNKGVACTSPAIVLGRSIQKEVIRIGKVHRQCFVSPASRDRTRVYLALAISLWFGY
jgi:hypothetical protein